MKKIKVGDKITIEATDLFTNMLLEALGYDFSTPSKITEIYHYTHVTGEVLIIGFDDYVREDAESIIEQDIDGVEICNVIGRKIYGNIMLIPLDGITMTVNEENVFKAGDEVILKTEDMVDVMMGVLSFEEFGVDVYDGKPRKISSIIRLTNGEFGLQYCFISFEGVHRLEPKVIEPEGNIIQDLKKQGVELLEYGDYMLVLEETLTKVN